MQKRMRIIFWSVAVIAAVVTFSGITYAGLSLFANLKLVVFGRSVPALFFGLVITYLGGNILYRLYHLYGKLGSLETH